MVPNQVAGQEQQQDERRGSTRQGGSHQASSPSVRRHADHPLPTLAWQAVAADNAYASSILAAWQQGGATREMWGMDYASVCTVLALIHVQSQFLLGGDEHDLYKLVRDFDRQASMEHRGSPWKRVCRDLPLLDKELRSDYTPFANTHLFLNSFFYLHDLSAFEGCNQETVQVALLNYFTGEAKDSAKPSTPSAPSAALLRIVDDMFSLARRLFPDDERLGDSLFRAAYNSYVTPSPADGKAKQQQLLITDAILNLAEERVAHRLKCLQDSPADRDDEVAQLRVAELLGHYLLSLSSQVDVSYPYIGAGGHWSPAGQRVHDLLWERVADAHARVCRLYARVNQQLNLVADVDDIHTTLINEHIDWPNKPSIIRQQFNDSLTAVQHLLDTLNEPSRLLALQQPFPCLEHIRKWRLGGALDKDCKKPLLSYSPKGDNLAFLVNKWSATAERFASEDVSRRRGLWEGDKDKEPGNPSLLRGVSGQDFYYPRPSDSQQRQDNSSRVQQGRRNDGRNDRRHDRRNGRQQEHRGRNF